MKDKKKKIIFVTQALWIGGIETALVNLLNHLDYEQFDITCLVTENYLQMAKHITPKCRLLVADRHSTVSFQKQYRFQRLYDWMEEPQNASKSRRLLWKILKAPEMRLYAAYLKEQLKGEHFDTAVIYSDRVAELTVRGISADRFLMFYHNAEMGKAYHDGFGYRASEKIVAVSEAQCKKLMVLRPRYADKMLAIPNYVDVEATLEKAGKGSAEAVFPETGIHIVSCGRLAHQKGFDIAIEACAKLVKMGYSDLHWYILGTGPDKKYLESLIQEYRVADNFHLLGVKSNPFPYMQAAALYVQPSRSEGYSLSVLEARVLACPVVATYAAAEEQLTDGVSGTLCETSAEAIAAAVARHLENPELSDNYRKALRAFSFDDVNTKIMQKIESLL